MNNNGNKGVYLRETVKPYLSNDNPYSVFGPHPKVRSLNFEFEIDFISDQYEKI